MSDNIIQFTGTTTVDLPVDQILDKAKEAGLQTVVVIGDNKDGELYIASSQGRVCMATFLLQRALHALMTTVS